MNCIVTITRLRSCLQGGFSVEPFPSPQPDPDRLCLEINAVVLQALLCGLMGAGFAAISVLWKIGSRCFLYRMEHGSSVLFAVSIKHPLLSSMKTGGADDLSRLTAAKQGRIPKPWSIR